PELVNFLRRKIRGRDAPNVVAVPRGAVRERPHTRIGAPLRRVLLVRENREALIRGDHIALYRRQHTVAKTFLLRCRDTRRKLLDWLRERASLPSLAREFVGLRRNFLEQIFWRHQLVFHALPHVRRDLLERARKLAEARDIVLVIRDVVERRQSDDAGKPKMQAVHLIHRHLPRLELRALDLLAKLTNYQRQTQRVLFRKPLGIDGFKASQ